MHILILADAVDNQRAGVHVYTSNIIKALLKIDHQNTYSFLHEKENIFFKNLNNFIIPKKKIPGYGIYRKFILIPNLIKKLQPDIVIETAHIGPFRTKKPIKKVTVIHDLTPILFPQFHLKRSAIIHKLFLKKILKNSDLIITASETTKNDILKYSDTKAKIAVIPLGIDHAPTHDATSTTSTPSTSVINAPYLLYLGTIEPRKNLETLISSFKILKEKHNIPHKLILAGEIGWKTQKILTKINSTKDIILTGYINDKEKTELYKNASIFIYPSLYEGFGLPPLEAMFHNIPVICSDGGSLQEIFSKNALIFEKENVAQLSKHILTLLKNPELKTELVKNGATFAKEFQWETTAKLTLQELTKLK